MKLIALTVLAFVALIIAAHAPQVTCRDYRDWVKHYGGHDQSMRACRWTE